MKLSKKGISLNDQKMEALMNFKIPENASVLHSFLGLSVYASRWIPNLAIIAEPLWRFTRKDVRWEWNEEYQKLTDNIKQSIKGKVSFFKLNWHTQVHVDASPIGLGAFVIQVNPKNKEEINLIACTSSTLSEPNKNYPHVEKEALGCVWACERNQIYLLGHHFTLYSDNKVVTQIFNNPKSKPSARIPKWQIRGVEYGWNTA